MVWFMSVAWLVQELQTSQLLVTNTFLNAHDLLMDQFMLLYFIEKMFCDSLLKISYFNPY